MIGLNELAFNHISSILSDYTRRMYRLDSMFKESFTIKTNGSTRLDGIHPTVLTAVFDRGFSPSCFYNLTILDFVHISRYFKEICQDKTAD